jgi:hypothetical protein
MKGGLRLGRLSTQRRLCTGKHILELESHRLSFRGGTTRPRNIMAGSPSAINRMGKKTTSALPADDFAGCSFTNANAGSPNHQQFAQVELPQ